MQVVPFIQSLPAEAKKEVRIMQASQKKGQVTLAKVIEFLQSVDESPRYVELCWTKKTRGWSPVRRMKPVDAINVDRLGI